MKTPIRIPISEFRRKFSEHLEKIRHGGADYILMRYGAPVARVTADVATVEVGLAPAETKEIRVDGSSAECCPKPIVVPGKAIPGIIMPDEVIESSKALMGVTAEDVLSPGPAKLVRVYGGMDSDLRLKMAGRPPDRPQRAVVPAPAPSSILDDPDDDELFG